MCDIYQQGCGYVSLNVFSRAGEREIGEVIRHNNCLYSISGHVILLNNVDFELFHLSKKEGFVMPSHMERGFFEDSYNIHIFDDRFNLETCNREIANM